MHRHDLDLISEYAAGSLADTDKARSLVESCDVCRSEFESQKSVMAILRSTEPLSMTEHEKAALHRDLWTALRSPGSNPVPAIRPRVTWAAGAAAVVLVLVGVVGALNSSFRSDSVTETFSEIGGALDDGSGQVGQSGEEADSDGSGLAGAPTANRDYFYDDSTDFAAVAKLARDESETAASESSFSPEDTTCLEQSGLIGYSLAPGVELLTRLLVAVPSEPGETESSVAFIDRDSCELVHLED